VPPLTALALDAVVEGFAVRPSLVGVPPRYMPAIGAKLPLDLDICLTAPNVEDEAYWRRVCLEGRRWTKCEIAEHGGSWKQLFLERALAELLEAFGQHPDVPVDYEAEFCRPAIDSTHPRWPLLYAKVAPTRPDGRPVRERFSANTVLGGADGAALSSDADLLAATESGWPVLEHLKEAARASMASYAKSFAWASVADRAGGAVGGVVGAGGAGAAGGAGGVAAGAGGVSAPGTAVAGSRGGPRPNALVMPFSMAAEALRAEAAAVQQRTDDALDGTATGEQLREYVSPADLEAWKRTGSWPAERGDSLLAIRYRELAQLLGRLVAAADYVYSLEVQQMPSHLDVELILSRLPNLTSLQLSYGMRHLGMRYDRSLFGMRLTDADSLARCLRVTDALTSLALPCNMIDDNLVMVLMTGLLENRTLTALDLSHNSITAAGVQLLAKLLKAPCVLTSLNLADNKADEKAAKHLAKALRTNDSLLELNLRLNDLGDEGGRILIDALRSNATLTRQLGDRAQLEVRRMTRVICMSVLLTRVNRSSTSSAKTR